MFVCSHLYHNRHIARDSLCSCLYICITTDTLPGIHCVRVFTSVSQPTHCQGFIVFVSLHLYHNRCQGFIVFVSLHLYRNRHIARDSLCSCLHICITTDTLTEIHCVCVFTSVSQPTHCQGFIVFVSSHLYHNLHIARDSLCSCVHICIATDTLPGIHCVRVFTSVSQLTHCQGFTVFVSLHLYHNRHIARDSLCSCVHICITTDTLPGIHCVRVFTSVSQPTHCQGFIVFVSLHLYHNLHIARDSLCSCLYICITTDTLPGIHCVRVFTSVSQPTHCQGFIVFVSSHLYHNRHIVRDSLCSCLYICITTDTLPGIHCVRVFTSVSQPTHCQGYIVFVSSHLYHNRHIARDSLCSCLHISIPTHTLPGMHCVGVFTYVSQPTHCQGFIVFVSSHLYHNQGWIPRRVVSAYDVVNASYLPTTIHIYDLEIRSINNYRKSYDIASFLVSTKISRRCRFGNSKPCKYIRSSYVRRNCIYDNNRVSANSSSYDYR